MRGAGSWRSRSPSAITSSKPTSPTPIARCPMRTRRAGLAARRTRCARRGHPRGETRTGVPRGRAGYRAPTRDRCGRARHPGASGGGCRRGTTRCDGKRARSGARGRRGRRRRRAAGPGRAGLGAGGGRGRGGCFTLGRRDRRRDRGTARLCPRTGRGAGRAPARGSNRGASPGAPVEAAGAASTMASPSTRNSALPWRRSWAMPRTAGSSRLRWCRDSPASAASPCLKPARAGRRRRPASPQSPAEPATGATGAAGAAGSPAAQRTLAEFLGRVADLGGARLLDAVRADPSGAVRRLVAESVWVPDLPSLIALQPSLPVGWTVVVRDGIRGRRLHRRPLRPARGCARSGRRSGTAGTRGRGPRG